MIGVSQARPDLAATLAAKRLDISRHCQTTADHRPSSHPYIDTNRHPERTFGSERIVGFHPAAIPRLPIFMVVRRHADNSMTCPDLPQ